MRKPFLKSPTRLLEAWFCGLLCLLIFTSSIDAIMFQIGRDWTHDLPIALDTSSLFLVLLSGSLLLALSLNRAFAQEFRNTLHTIVYRLDGRWLFLWMGWMLAGTLWSVERDLVLAGWIYNAASVAAALLVAYVVRKNWQRGLVIGVAIGAVVQSGVAIGQYQQRGWLGLTWLHEPAQFWGEGAVFRSHGLTGHPNSLAFFLIIALFILLGYMVAARAWWVGLAVPPILVALLYTGSRGNLVGVLLMVGLCGLYWLKIFRWRYAVGLLLVALVLLIVVFQLLPESTTARFKYLQGREATQTRLLWAYPNTAVMVNRAPILGVGTDTLLYEIYKYWDHSYRQLVHNTVLIIWAEQGIIGVMLYLMTASSFANRLHPRNRFPDYLLAAGFIGMTLAMLLDVYFTYPHFRTLIFCYWGYIWGQSLLTLDGSPAA